MYYRLKAEFRNDPEGRKIAGQKVTVADVLFPLSTYHPNEIVKVTRNGMSNRWYIKSSYLEPYNEEEFWNGKNWVKKTDAWIIGRKEKDYQHLIMSTRPSTYNTFDKALKEAERLANFSVGDTFVIFKEIKSVTVEKPKYQIGDQIKIISLNTGFRIGSIATVIDCKDNIVRIQGVTSLGNLETNTLSADGTWGQPFPYREVT